MNSVTVTGEANKPMPKPKRVIGRRLRILLVVVLALFTLLAANGMYLFAITWLEHFTGQVYQDFFYQIMFLVHLVLGLIIDASNHLRCNAHAGLAQSSESPRREDWICFVHYFHCGFDKRHIVNASAGN